ncbi:MAG TPA: OmpA family protein [Edaphobacter sp.]|nr:OmpA family protein [Edaphobacter sp.]
MNRTTESFSARALSALLIAGCALSISSFALGQTTTTTTTTQTISPTQESTTITKKNGVYFTQVKVVHRDLDAVNYLHRSGSTKIGFQGTSLLPKAEGEAKVQSERGRITIDASFKGLPPANGFGPEYLTYVLWAITPDGRATNLAEILPAGKKNDIHVTTGLQSFGLIVTAEPYFAVTTPSDVVVLQNDILKNKTNGVLEKVNAHYALLPRGFYAPTDGAKTVANPITRDEKAPLELYEAYNALRIAQANGADKYATDIWNEAKQDLQNAADISNNKKGDRKMAITYARQSVQRSEDARLVSLRKQADERQLNAQRTAQQSKLAAQQSQLQAQQAALEAERAQTAKAKADAEAAEARARAAEANKAAESANAVRERLRSQLNSVLATSETARGLIVNMSDVLFDTGKYTLKPATQISLAKVAGILQAYPGLKLQVEGYTDNTGSDMFNQKLSENRADAVRSFLIAQGVSPENITSTGYGKSNPVADNSTSAGRAKNRRVQLVVSGNAIGIKESSPPSEAPPAQPQPNPNSTGTSNPPQ